VQSGTAVPRPVGGAGVSIVVCSRDRPEQLAGALAAIALVRRPEDELIVVDSASHGDATVRAAQQGGADHVVRCTLPGLSRARNAGLRAASRDVVAFTDDDCLPEQGWLEELSAALAEPGVAVATGAVRPVGEGFLSGMTQQTASRQCHPFPGNPSGHGANMAMRRARLLAVGGFDERLGAGAPLRAADDWDVFLRLVREEGALAYTPRAVVRHEQWRSTRQALRVRHGYSLGAGALAVKCWKLGSPGDRVQARWLLTGRLREGAQAVLRGALTLHWFRVAAGIATLTGAARGAAAALRLDLRNGHLVAGRPDGER
jgi:glycosyltransferase involved in cell wall biosynthesis